MRHEVKQGIQEIEMFVTPSSIQVVLYGLTRSSNVLLHSTSFFACSFELLSLLPSSFEHFNFFSHLHSAGRCGCSPHFSPVESVRVSLFHNSSLAKLNRCALTLLPCRGCRCRNSLLSRPFLYTAHCTWTFVPCALRQDALGFSISFKHSRCAMSGASSPSVCTFP